MRGSTVAAGMLGAGVDVRVHIVVSGVEGITGSYGFTAARAAGVARRDQLLRCFDVATFGTVGVRRESCRGPSRSVALSPSGLRGGSAAPLGNEFECFAPKQVIVRVRAVLAAPGALRAGQDFQSAHVPVREAKLTVRTVTGKPLVYADVSESGRARIFAAKGCSQQ